MVQAAPGTSALNAPRGFFSKPHRNLIAAVVLAGVLVTLAGSWWLWSTERDKANRALNSRTQVVVDSTNKALSDAMLRLASVAGLFQASESVTEIEFRRFVKRLGTVPGLEAISYMPIVMGRNRTAFEAAIGVSEPDYEIFDIDESGERLPAGERRMHLPLLWYEPVEAFDHIAGFDSMSDDNRVEVLEQVRVTRGNALSPFVTLISENEPDGFLIYGPITDAETDALTGYATAAMDLSRLMDGAISEASAPLLNWEVIDVTDSGPISISTAGAGLIEQGGRTWQIVITPAANSDMTPDPTATLVVLVTGLLATSLVAIALLAQRRNRSARGEFEKLRELAQAKDQFLASVGHELRTPLTSVLGFAELLRSDASDLTDAERMAMISTVADEATDLASIVDDLLVAARSELDLLVVSEVQVSAHAQVAQVLEMSGKGAFEHIKVVADPGHPYRALGDPSRVRQILRNLITNACRYGGEQVEVRLQATTDLVGVLVADNGAGVPDGDGQRIFDPYYRAHSSGSQPAALGIGLSVARQLARLMKGDLSYRREDGWTIFELQLPVYTDVDSIPFDSRPTLIASSPI